MVFQPLEMCLPERVSFEVWGLLCDLVTPRSASRKAVALAFMGPPRSACSVSCPGGTPCLAKVSSNKALNRAVSSAAATHQPSGKRVEWDGIDVFPIEDGLIKRKDVYSNSWTVPAQIAAEG